MNPFSLLLRRHHRRAVWLRPLWIGAAGLAWSLTLVRLEAPLAWHFKLLAATAAFALLARIWRQPTLRDTACELDAKARLNNRLETLVELGDRSDALATAARHEIGAHVSTRPTPRPYLWMAGLALFTVLLSVNVAEFLSRPAPLSGLRIALVPESTPLPQPVLPVVLPPAGPPPSAAFRWLSPDEAITATAKNEIPVAAEAESITGLRRVFLHVARNGEDREPLPLTAELEPGVKPVAAAVLLEPVDAKPYDIVTYHLAAERVRPPGVAPEPVWPPVYSPLQFVEIRPAREEPMSDPAPDDPAGAVLRTIRQLKEEQRALARDSFALGHGLPDKNDLGWPELVRAVATRQTSVLGQTEAVVPPVAANRFPVEVGDRLREALTAMQSAATALAQPEPAVATAPAIRALSQLVAAEDLAARFLWEKRLREAAAAAEQPIANSSDLPNRAETPAGRLEQLAAQQSTIADQLAARTAPAGIFSEQDALARDIAKLAAEKAFPPAINALIQTAGVAAKESTTQLNERDLEAATEPATRSAQDLREALDALDTQGRQRATDLLLAVQRSFNRAANDLFAAPDAELPATARPAGDRVDLAQTELQAAARQEQQTGSAEAARQLSEVADAIGRSEVKRDLTAVANPATGRTAAAQRGQGNAAAGKLRELAQQSATASNRTRSNPPSMDAKVAELRRMQAELDRIAGRDPADNGPLRWVSPGQNSSAQPKETVALVAEARSQNGYSRLQLRVRVNGEAQPAIALPISIGPGTHPVPVSLNLEDFKVRLSDTVSYTLTATPTGAPTTETVSTRVQLITIRAPRTPPPNAANPNAQEQQYIAAVRALVRAQRLIVDRAHVENDGAKPAETASPGPFRQIETDQRTNRADTSSVVQTYAQDLPTEHRALLSEAQSEMQKAEEAWQRSAPAAATPPAIRALTALMKILEGEGEGVGGGSGPGGGNGSGGNTPGQGQAADYSTTMSNAITLAQSGEVIGPINAAGIPPPPGPNAEPRVIREYAGALSDRLGRIIELAEEQQRLEKRKEVLTTANPAEAPPSFRPVVADYFEKLARERSAPPAGKP